MVNSVLFDCELICFWYLTKAAAQNRARL